MRAVVEERIDPVALLPVYQDTVLALVPATSEVAVAGVPETRMGGSSKKLLDAAIAEAAVSEVLPIWLRPAVRAACRLIAVAAAVAPMVNWLVPGVVEAVACSVNFCVVPSGRLNVKVTVSPSLGLPAPRSTEMAAGEPVGPLTVAPVRVELTPASLRPNGEPATSSFIETTEPEAGGITRRPSPSAPRSAWLRSEMTCLRPASAPLPLRMWSGLSTEG